MTWAYSANGADYYNACMTKQEAIAEALAEHDAAIMSDLWESDFLGDSFYVGECIPFVPEINEWWVIEYLIDEAADFAGEYSTSYLSAIPKEALPELREGLQRVFDEWSKKHGLEPTFFIVEKSEEIDYETARALCQKATNDAVAKSDEKTNERPDGDGPDALARSVN